VGAIATEYSFDVVSRVDMAEVGNAVQQVAKEISTRFDLQGTRAAVQLDAKQAAITLTAEDEQQMRNLLEMLQQRLAKRGVSLKALEVGSSEPAAGGTLRRTVTLRQGIPADKGKEMARILRDSKIKVTAQIQGDQLRVAGSKKDDLQAAITLLKQRDFGMDLQFVNYR
jgi:hypothetical protein